MRIHQIKGNATGWISATTNIRRISNSQNHPSFLSQKNHRRKKKTSLVPPERSLDSLSSSSSPPFPLADLKVTGSRKKKSQQWCYSRLERPVFPQRHCFSHNVLCIWHDDKFSEFIREWEGWGGAINLIWHGRGSLWAEFFLKSFLSM